jgi:NADPH:quinone reductase-like Zn-dependent oxidoreductase
MKAIVQDKYGSPDALALREIDTPGIKDNQVLVRVHAAAVNPLDWHFVRGQPRIARLGMGPRKPKNRVRGVDVAGQIEAVGEDVRRSQAGDEVFGGAKGPSPNMHLPEKTRSPGSRPTSHSTKPQLFPSRLSRHFEPFAMSGPYRAGRRS